MSKSKKAAVAVQINCAIAMLGPQAEWQSDPETAGVASVLAATSLALILGGDAIKQMGSMCKSWMVETSGGKADAMDMPSGEFTG